MKIVSRPQELEKIVGKENGVDELVKDWGCLGKEPPGNFISPL